MVVYIVGAGPGDPGLVTLKAKALIAQADVIIYDKLVNPEVLAWARADCVLEYVGKREKSAGASQDIQTEIHDLLRRYGHDKKVVRLKGGDPYIFGRGGEEAQVCVQAGIPFEVVPGVSSAFAVPLYAGIPVTHRDANSAFAVLTGHEAEKNASVIDWKALPETIVILMGVSTSASIAQRLIAAGRPKTTPVAAIYNGTTPEQRTVISDLGAVAEVGVPVDPPAIIVVGPVVAFHDELAWFEKKLARARGTTVILTGVASHFPDNAALLGSYGIRAINMPLIDIVERSAALPDFSDYDALIFTSQEGVRRVAPEKIQAFGGVVYAIGPKTKNMLAALGVDARIGERYNSAGLADCILASAPQGSRLLALRSAAASSVLADMLAEHAQLDEVHLYDITTLPPDREQLAAGDAVFVMSASCARVLSAFDDAALAGTLIVAIGPETSAALKKPHVTAQTYTLQGMIDAYLNVLWTGFV